LLRRKKSPSKEQPPSDLWKIMIVDDEPEVHNVTKMVLKDFTFLDKEIEFISAYSKQEAETLLKDHPEISIVLLDVVMEEDDSGLQLVKTIRDKLRNQFVRIILRTGQPGQAPEKAIIVDYDINDYKAKSELTAEKLYTTIIASLRAFDLLHRIEKTSLEKARLELELETTAAVQKALFPKSLPEVSNLKFHTYFASATRAGGDWYGFMTKISGYLYILIGDVTGHGAPAALVTATACATTRLIETVSVFPGNRRTLSPGDFLSTLNTNIYLTGFPDFLMTFFCRCN